VVFFSLVRQREPQLPSRHRNYLQTMAPTDDVFCQSAAVCIGKMLGSPPGTRTARRRAAPRAVRGRLPPPFPRTGRWQPQLTEEMRRRLRSPGGTGELRDAPGFPVCGASCVWFSPGFSLFAAAFLSRGSSLPARPPAPAPAAGGALGAGAWARARCPAARAEGGRGPVSSRRVRGAAASALKGREARAWGLTPAWHVVCDRCPDSAAEFGSIAPFFSVVGFWLKATREKCGLARCWLQQLLLFHRCICHSKRRSLWQGWFTLHLGKCCSSIFVSSENPQRQNEIKLVASSRRPRQIVRCHF